MFTKKELIEQERQQSFNVHDNLKEHSLDELRRIVADDRLDYSVMCLNIAGSLNVGNIIRTAHILGASMVFVVGKPGYDGRSVVGADKYFPVIKIDAIDKNGEIDKEVFKDVVYNYRLAPIFCETGGIDYRKVDWRYLIRNDIIQYQEHPCIVMGNEGLGIPSDILYATTKNPFIVSIPQKGVMRSLNVSSAFAILCSHMVNKVWD